MVLRKDIDPSRGANVQQKEELHFAQTGVINQMHTDCPLLSGHQLDDFDLYQALTVAYEGYTNPVVRAEQLEVMRGMPDFDHQDLELSYQALVTRLDAELQAVRRARASY
jgi:hypothetical protein